MASPCPEGGFLSRWKKIPTGPKCGGGWLSASLPHEQAAPLVMSLLSLVITLSLSKKFHYDGAADLIFFGQLILCWLVSLRSFQVGIDRWLLIIPVVLILRMVASWPYSANHHWFYLWVAIPILLRPDLLPGIDFSRYVGLSMGIMMLVAFIQKLVGGHYLDGSFLAYFAAAGGEMERLLNHLCSEPLTQSRMTPCHALIWLGWLSLAAQLIVGLLLVLDVRNRTVYIGEMAFLLVVGTIADEWVFQSINILCLLFVMRGRVPIWVLFGIIPFTLVGIYKLDNIMRVVFW